MIEKLIFVRAATFSQLIEQILDWQRSSLSSRKLSLHGDFLTHRANPEKMRLL